MPTKTTRTSLTRKLKLKPSQLAVAFRHIRPNWKAYLDYVESAAKEGDQEMAKYLSAWVSLTRREQSTILPEQICELSGIKPETLFGAVCTQLWAQSKMECNIITATLMPRVVERTMKNAASKGGVRDREMVHKHTGFIPTPKPNPSAPPIFINTVPGVLPNGSPAPRLLTLPSMEEEALDLESLNVPSVDSTPTPEPAA